MSNQKKSLRLSPFYIVLGMTVMVSPWIIYVSRLAAESVTPMANDGTVPASGVPTVTVPSAIANEATPAPQPNPAIQSQPSDKPAPKPDLPQSNEATPTGEKPPVNSGETPSVTPTTGEPDKNPPTNLPSNPIPSFSGTETTPTAPPEPTAPEPRVLVSEVLITGADSELETLIYNTLQTKPGRVATRSQLQEDVNAIYATGYFSNVKVTPKDTPLGVQVTFAVDQNPILRQVVIETVPSKDAKEVLPPEILQKSFGDQYGKTLNLRDLQNGIKQLNEWYAKNGYDLAQVVGAPKVESDGTVKLIIAEGFVQDIKVRFFDAEDAPAQGKTRDFIVTREMQLKPGDTFNRNLAQKDLQRVFGLGLFEDVRLSFSPGEDPRAVIVNVDVVEGNTGSIAAGAGISSSSGLFGTLSYQEKNLGGNNQTIGGEVQVGQRELLFDVNFTDPWIAGDPYRTSYTVNGFRRRTISLVYDGNTSSIRTENGFDSPYVVRTGAGVNFTRPIAKDVFSKPDWFVSTGFIYQHVQVTNSNGDIAPISAPLNGYPSQLLAFSSSGQDDLFIFSIGASQDTRNSPLQPTSGSVFRIGMEQTAPIGSGSVLFNRVRANYSFYLPVDFVDFGFIEENQPKPQAFAFNFQAGTVLGDLPPYEAFVVGGSNSVRGYDEGEVGNGRSFFQATAEYRFPVISAVGGAFFIDFGTLLGSDVAVPGIPSVIRGLPGNGTGYGLGLRIQSPVGPIRVDYGFRSTGGSRLSFGIGERF